MSSLSAAVFASPTIGWPEVLLRIFVAAALGGAIGVERELRERQAGLRTHLVVSVGAALFTLVSAYGFADFGARVDPTRIAAQVVTGIGFLGAGAIIRQGLSVRGLTTAASLWLVAAIGMAAGAGYWEGALIATFGALITLGPLRVVSFRILSRFRPGIDRLLVEIPAGGSPAPIIDAIERSGGRLVSLDVTQEGERRSVAADIELPGGAAASIVAGVAEIDGVLEVRWME
ncbi:MAG TPA: MgtC/SapB family protein [Gaiellaceae bacterium]|nr:MgtC/SapB family protein [Gaiellaceae bacterium]